MSTVLPVLASDVPTARPLVSVIEWVDLKPAEPVSHYDRSRLVQCALGDILARVITDVSGANSQDVTRRTPLDAVRLGRNVQWNAEHSAIVSTVGGKVLLAGDKISVEPLLEISQDVGFNVGNIDFDGDVIVRKSVLERFKVHATGNVSIGGTADEADVTAKGEVHVGGGVVGKGKGKLVSGGDTHARFISQATVKVGGNLFVRNEIAQSTIECAGEVDVTNGSILASTVAAAGVKCHTAGSQGGAKTIFVLGGENDLLKTLKEQTQEMLQLRARRSSIRKQIGKLQQRQKNLKANEKETLTELLFESEESDAKITSVTKSLNDAYRQSRTRKGISLQVSSRLLAGVIVRCPGFETTIKEDLRGPLTILVRRDAKDGGFVSVDVIRKIITPLPTHRTADEANELVNKLNADDPE